MSEATYDYVLDPEGEVIFTLHDANASDIWHGEAPDGETLDEEPPIDDLPIDEPPADEQPTDEQPADKQPTDKQPVDGPSVLTDAGANVEGLPPESVTTKITFRVSSRHLILASCVFKKMLRGGWIEDKVRDDGHFHIMGEGWNVEALLIVMNIIHGHNGDVPRHVNLALLTNIATIVDYYQLHEAAEVFSSIWMEKLRKSVPTTYSQDLMLWICVSQIFSEKVIFQAVTSTAIRHIPEIMENWNLPVLRWVEDEVKLQRMRGIEQIIRELHILKENLLLEKMGCSSECSSIYLGALMKGMKNLSILEQREHDPFPGKSLAEAIESIRRMQTPSWRRGGSRRCYIHACTLSGFFDPFLQDLENSISGLVLEDFTKSSSSSRIVRC